MRRYRRARLSDFVVRRDAGRIAIFVAAWDESRVIGAMLATALARIEHPNYRLYVGTYPNDRATIDAVIEVARRDARVRLVIGPHPGPTTKIGRAHVCTPVTHAHLVCRTLLENKNKTHPQWQQQSNS